MSRRWRFGYDAGMSTPSRPSPSPSLSPSPVGPIPPTEGPLTMEELQLATRNRGMPLEGLRYDLTPTGMHYLLVHFDIPALDAASYRLRLGGAVERPFALSLEELRA